MPRRSGAASSPHRCATGPGTTACSTDRARRPRRRGCTGSDTHTPKVIGRLLPRSRSRKRTARFALAQSSSCGCTRMPHAACRFKILSRARLRSQVWGLTRSSLARMERSASHAAACASMEEAARSRRRRTPTSIASPPATRCGMCAGHESKRPPRPSAPAQPSARAHGQPALSQHQPGSGGSARKHRASEQDRQMSADAVPTQSCSG